MQSERLRYHTVTIEDLDAFHSLVENEYVRRYLLDGNLLPRGWSDDRIRQSEGLFERRGVGIWMATDLTTNELVRFCGILEIPASGFPVRSTPPRWRAPPSPTRVLSRTSASVDEVNAASLHVLEKLGFERIATQ
jgi:RimJ/RimL family protein N-acetyltransferase